MNAKLASAVCVFLTLSTAASGAYALGNACRRLNFSVDNDYGQAIRVKSFQLYSQSEGRWIDREDFPNTDVPAGAKDFVVARNQTVNNVENDTISAIRVRFDVFVDNDPDAPGRWVERTRTDSNIADKKCVADRWYKATINR